VARSAIPNPLDRRHQIERQLAPEAARRVAEAYLQAGRAWEAIAFLQKAEARDRLVELRTEAEAAGDVFLVRELSRALRDDLDAARWRAVAEAAAAAGKDLYAAQARRLAERSAALGDRPGN
jgi:hypothetical protein